MHDKWGHPVGPNKIESTGAKHDTGKRRWHLLPFGALGQVVDVLMFGNTKYSEGTWRRVENAREMYFDAVLRHVIAWYEGERVDVDSGQHHLAHACCCVLFLLAMDRE